MVKIDDTIVSFIVIVIAIGLGCILSKIPYWVSRYLDWHHRFKKKLKVSLSNMIKRKFSIQKGNHWCICDFCGNDISENDYYVAINCGSIDMNLCEDCIWNWSNKIEDLKAKGERYGSA